MNCDECGTEIESVDYGIQIGSKFYCVNCAKDINKAEELKIRYEQDLKKLQDNCKHNPSDWIDIIGIPSIFNRTVINCLICDKQLHRKFLCKECEKELVDDERIPGDGEKTFYSASYCKKCFDKGDPECIKLKTLVDEHERKKAHEKYTDTVTLSKKDKEKMKNERH